MTTNDDAETDAHNPPAVAMLTSGLVSFFRSLIPGDAQSEQEPPGTNALIEHLALVETPRAGAPIGESDFALLDPTVLSYALPLSDLGTGVAAYFPAAFNCLAQNDNVAPGYIVAHQAKAVAYVPRLSADLHPMSAEDAESVTAPFLDIREDTDGDEGDDDASRDDESPTTSRTNGIAAPHHFHDAFIGQSILIGLSYRLIDYNSSDADTTPSPNAADAATGPQDANAAWLSVNVAWAFAEGLQHAQVSDALHSAPIPTIAALEAPIRPLELAPIETAPVPAGQMLHDGALIPLAEDIGSEDLEPVALAESGPVETDMQVLADNAILNLIQGSSDADQIWGSDGADQIEAGSGDDTIYGSAGDDRIDGGDGHDTLDYSAFSSDLHFEIAQGTATGEEIGEDHFENVEVLIGGSGNDTFVFGGTAAVVAGGRGQDVFIFTATEQAPSISHQLVYEILDFVVGDRIHVADYEISSSAEQLEEERFWDVYDDFAESFDAGVPLRITYAFYDDAHHTVIEADFDRNDIYEFRINLEGVQLPLNVGLVAA